MSQYKNTIEKAALGRVAELGDMYNARDDTFCGTSILKKKPEGSVLSQVDRPYTEIVDTLNDTQKDRVSSVGVDAELHMSFMSGKIKLDGAANYLSEEKSSAREAKCSFIYKIQTVAQMLKISDENFQSFIQYNSFKATNATHVVVQVNYGASAVLSLKADTGSKDDKTVVGGHLKAVFDFKAVKIDGSVDVKINDKDMEKFNNFNFKVHADLLIDGKLPSTIDKALELICNVPELVKKSNGGRGIAQSYLLLPMSTLCEYLNIGDIKADQLLKSIDEAIINDYVQFFEDLSEYKVQLLDVQALFKKYNMWISQEEINNLTKYIADIGTWEQEFKSKLGLLLIEVRSGTRPISSLEEQLSDYKKDKLSFKKIQLYLNGLNPLTQKISFALMLQDEGVQILPRDGDFIQLLLKNGSAEQFVIFSNTETDDELQKTRMETFQLFFNLVRQHSKSDEGNKTGEPVKPVFIFIDLEVNPKLASEASTTTLKLYKGVTCLSHDFKKQHDLEKNTNFCKSNEGKAVGAGERPHRCVQLEVPCANLGVCHHSEPIKWSCEKCKKEVMFDFKESCYCGCSVAKAASLEFLCSDPKHGPMFKAYEDPQVLKHYLSKLRTTKELNVLLLGATGVGKSTWINATANYLSFTSLQNAAAADLTYMIPTNFTVADINRKPQEVKVGSPEEGGKTFHVIPWGETAVRFIDTPGLGHADGVGYDLNSVNSIVDNLKFLEELHAICILVKPDEHRVDQQFRYVFEQLMARIPKSAAANVVFCVTHTADNRDMKLLVENQLKSLQIDVFGSLADTIVFTVDNEPFKYLCSLGYDNVKTSPAKLEGLKKSWDQSRNQTLRLLRHLKTYVTPFNTLDMINLNDARSFVYYTSQPITEIKQKNPGEFRIIDDLMRKLRTYYTNNALTTKRDALLKYLNYVAESADSVSKSNKMKEEQEDITSGATYLYNSDFTQNVLSGNVIDAWEGMLQSISAYKNPMTAFMNDCFLDNRSNVQYKSAIQKVVANKSVEMEVLMDNFQNMLNS